LICADAEKPLLYSFRRCPYAIRARFAIAVSGQQVLLREVRLSQKPDQLRAVSAKATVPVLLLSSGEVIDESLDIMLWALRQHDPERWLDEETQSMSLELIQECETEFKLHLDHYKYAERFPQHSQTHYRTQAQTFLYELERRLQSSRYLLTSRAVLADIAILPFVRQFAGVDADWFGAEHPVLAGWMNHQLESHLFQSVMARYSVWKAGDEEVLFPRLSC